ncbi:MAG TPA: EAL domain-containing protein [Acidimicrobiales bacterium]|nr:EAL domain-containing protein [Acidimicrobiales bacterium]
MARENVGPTSGAARPSAWFTLADLPAGLALAIIVVLFPVSWAAAYWLGGGTNVLPEWFLIPILLAGLRFGPLGALLAGLAATFVAGPLLPASTATGTPQAASDWVTRGVFFVIIGELVTYLFMMVRRTTGGAVQAETKHESEQRFRALVQRATDMITVIDATGCVHYDSPAVERILGWAPPQRLGRNAGAIVHPDDQPAAGAAWNAVIADPSRPQTIEVRLLDTTGSWHWAESTFTNLLDEATVEGIVINHRVVDERKALQDELQHRAWHDSLTGLANRGLLRDRVDGSVPAVYPDGDPTSVLFIDLDDFKTVNDGLGHDTGDQLLVQVSDRLLKCVGPSDLVARLGGDEFAVLVAASPDGPAAGGSVAQRIINAMQEPFDVGGHRMYVSTSIGIATCTPGAADADSVLMQADIAMYHAKANGKNQFVFFTDEMHKGVLHRLAVESWLRDALASNQFQVHYQPIVALADQRIDAVEALARWEHPTLGLLTPGDFIEIAEVTGLIVPLGRFVLRDACYQIRRWRDEYDEHMMVSVNLSAAQLRDHEIVSSVREALDDAGIPPAALMIEVTEGALIGDVAGATSVLESLHGLGVTIAIDDFGTGYSSLSHLQRFPVDVLKVDKSFVDGLCKGNDEATLVRSVLAIGAEFGLQVVAEGIESAEQDAELRRLGCDYGQGYLYAAGMTAPELDELWRLERELETLGGAGLGVPGAGTGAGFGPGSGDGDSSPDAAETMAAVAETIASAARCRRPGGQPSSGAGLHDATVDPTEPAQTSRSSRSSRSRRSA